MSNARAIPGPSLLSPTDHTLILTTRPRCSAGTRTIRVIEPTP